MDELIEDFLVETQEGLEELDNRYRLHIPTFLDSFLVCWFVCVPACV
jgi:hypothetical protein